MVALLALAAFLATPGASGAGYGWEFETGSYDYGPRLAGGPPTEHSFVLTNTGETRIERILWGIRWYLGPEGHQPLDEDLFRLETHPPCRTLEPGASCTMTVAFAPTSLGRDYGELQVYTGREGPSEAAVALLGTGAAPKAVVTPDAIDFGMSELGESSTRTVTVGNQGDLGLDIWNLSLSAASLPPSPFGLAGGSCVAGEEVPPAGSCTIEVSFLPTSPGTIGSELSIADDSPGAPQSIAIQGTGVLPPPTSAGPVSVAPPPIPPTETRPVVCPRGARRVLRHGRQTCVKRHRHRGRRGGRRRH